MAVNVGATIFPSTYPGSNDILVAGTQFDNAVGRPMATNCAVVYIKSTDFPVTMATRNVDELSGAGIPLVITTQLPYPVTSQGITNLANAFALWQAHGVVFDWVPYNEPNDNKGQLVFPTANDYITYVAGYAPTARTAGVTIVYKPLTSFKKTLLSYYPGDSVTDKVLADYYCLSFFNGGITLADAMSLADNHLPSPIPFGVGEFGFSATTSRPTTNQFTTWIQNEMLGVFAGRAVQGKPNDKIMWFALHPAGAVTSSTPPAVVAAIDLLYDQLMTPGPPPPPTVIAPDYPDFATPQAHADAISTTGVPLLALAGSIITSHTFSLAGGAVVVLPTVAINQLGYEMFVSAKIGAAATNPFVEVDNEWDDVSSGLPVAKENWVLPAGSGNNSYQVMVTGPTKGSLLATTITNIDGAVTATITITIVANSRIYGRDRIITFANNPPPNFSVSGGNAKSGIIGSASNQNVLGNTTFSTILGMYTGDASVYFDQAGNPAANSVAQLQALPVNKFGASSLWAGEAAGGVGLGVTVRVPLPKAPVLFSFVNSAAGAATINFKVTTVDERL